MEKEQVLNRLYNKINQNVFHGILPPVVLKINKGQRSSTGWGVTFQEYNHTYIIYVSQDRLRDGEIKIYENMLHQIFHILNMEKGISDTSRYKQYHNKHFAERATECGCTAEWERVNGYGQIKVPETLIKQIDYGTFSEAMDKAIELDNIRMANRNSMYIFHCPVCSRIAKASRSMKMYCGYCNVEMKIKDK